MRSDVLFFNIILINIRGEFKIQNSSPRLFKYDQTTYIKRKIKYTIFYKAHFLSYFYYVKVVIFGNGY